MAHQELLKLLQRFGARDEQDSGAARLFESFVREQVDCAQRELQIGHLTGSAWLVSADGARILLTHHRKLDRWLQLGGHADGASDMASVALREAEEESGLTDLSVEPEIFDLDRHWIPEYDEMPGHWHYDMRFVVQANGGEEFAVSEESHALAWREISEIAADVDADASLQRMAKRWVRRMASHTER